MAKTNITDTTLVSSHDRGSKEYNQAKGEAANKATGATAGTPGTWTPSGSSPPASTAEMTGITASPNTAWTTGQYVQTATAGVPGQTHWTGSAWAAGVA